MTWQRVRIRIVSHPRLVAGEVVEAEPDDVLALVTSSRAALAAEEGAMIEMTPERLRAFGDEMLVNGEFYADDAAMVDEFASAWETDRAFANEDATSMNNQLTAAQARIEALEKAALAVRFYYGEDSNEPLRMLDAALAAEEDYPRPDEDGAL